MFKIYDSNTFEELGPELIVRLSTAFYNRVYDDPDEWFTSMFPPDKGQAIQNQYEFFIQRFGGPQLYSQRKGHPALRQRTGRRCPEALLLACRATVAPIAGRRPLR